MPLYSRRVSEEEYALAVLLDSDLHHIIHELAQETGLAPMTVLLHSKGIPGYE